MMRSFDAGLLGLLGLGFASYTLSKTLRSGTARLRGGRRITRTRNPAQFWMNVLALCVLLCHWDCSSVALPATAKKAPPKRG
jgi:hypothetical protein